MKDKNKKERSKEGGGERERNQEIKKDIKYINKEMRDNQNKISS